MYINGLLMGDTSSPPPIQSNQTWFLGGPNFTGVIADARLYNRVLSDTEVFGLTSGSQMWYDYTEPLTVVNGRERRVFKTGMGSVRVSRRVAKIGRR
jgi:hypothetical protein